MEVWNKVRVGLAAKLAVCLVASTAGLFLLFGYFNLREQRRHSEEMVLQSAERITDVIQRSTRYEMLHNDREALYNVLAAASAGRRLGGTRRRASARSFRWSVS